VADQQRSTEAFVLGIDLGTTYSAAAIVRGGVVEPCVLGTIAAQVPTVVVHREDSEVLTGEAAERRAATEPTRAAREFKRRLGDPIPIIVGGTPYGAEALMAEMLAAIVRQVTLREGQSPTTIVLSHPANYSEYKLGLLREAARLAGLDLDRVRLITEPEAAAIAYARQQRIDTGEVIAVYDFGGGTFDAAVVRDAPDGFELIGTPEGMERLGGIDFDQAVLSHVDTALGGLVSAADGSDAQVLAGQARLRDDCRRAKEALSNDTDATIAVSLPGVQTEVRLTRDELEQMVRPRIAETVKALQRTIASAGITTDDVSRVLLVGGSSRMPIVAQIVKEAIGRPVSVDADPKLTIAIGAALSASPRPTTPADVVVPPTLATSCVEPAAVRSHVQQSRHRIIAGAVLVAAAAAAAIIVVATRGGDKSTIDRSTATTLAARPIVGATSTVQTQQTSTTISTSSTTSTGSSVAIASSDTVQRLAFDNSTSGLGIPGPAVAAGAPGVLNGLAVAHNGDVAVIASGSSVLNVSGGQVLVAAALPPAQSPAQAITIGSDDTIFVATPAGIVRVTNGAAELALDGRVAGLSSDLGPMSLDGGGNLYIADNGGSRVVRLAPDGGLTLVAGTGTPAAAGAPAVNGKSAASVPIGRVTGLAVDRAGRLLIADAGLHIVRAVASDGTISTVAGGGTVVIPSSVGTKLPDGAKAVDLAFSSIDALAVDVQGRMYVADGFEHAVIRIGADGVVDVVARHDAITAMAIGPSGAVIFADGQVVWSAPGAPGPT
jgi:actin-like ATPase involved in cell morphogenesis